MVSSGPLTPRFRLGLGELMLGIAVIAACLALGLWSIACGVLAALILLPTLARTIRVLHWRKALGRPVDAEARILAAFESVGRVLLAYTIALLAYIASLWLVVVVSMMLFNVFERTTLFTESLTMAWFAAGGTIVVTTTGATFAFWARRDWPIQDNELGRAPEPVDNPREPSIERVSDSSGDG